MHSNFTIRLDSFQHWEAQDFFEKPHHLLILFNQQLDNQAYYTNKEPFTIGKKHSQNNVNFNSDDLQNRHFHIKYKKSNYYARDLGSASGSYLKVSDIQLSQVFSDDKHCIFQIGRQIIQIQELHPKIKFKVTGKYQKQKQQTLHYIMERKSEITIGRKNINDIYFQDDQNLSTFHCLIYSYNGKSFLFDFHSTNGTWLRLGRPKSKSEYIQVKNNMVVRLGQRLNLRFKIKGQQYGRSNVCITCKKVQSNCLLIPCRHRILCKHCCQSVQLCLKCNQQIIQVVQFYKS